MNHTRSDNAIIWVILYPFQDLARIVTEAIVEGNINEILTIQMDDEMRYGEVRLKHHLLYAKCVDLPTVVESYKTADSVNLYKTADISQLLVCHREPIKECEKELEMELDIDLDKDYDMLEEDKESGSTKENKTTPAATDEAVKEIIPMVDVKFLWPHGLTPPFRHLRKRRLNIALRDKNIDPPESDVVKDVKYLLRMDSEAERIDYEVIGDDDVKTDFDLSDSLGSYDTDIDILDDDFLF